MSKLPTIPAAQTSATPSVRSQRSIPKTPALQPAAQTPSGLERGAGDAAVSVRSGIAPSQRSAQGSARASERSHRSQGSTGSISSSVALGKLAQLEKMLFEERRAREEAESTMLALQRERVAKEDATRRMEATEKQLASVMEAVKRVVSNPENPGNIRQLKNVLTGADTSGSTVSEQVAVNSDGRPRSFLDGVGQYERARDRAKKEAKAQLAQKSAANH